MSSSRQGPASWYSAPQLGRLRSGQVLRSASRLSASSVLDEGAQGGEEPHLIYGPGPTVQESLGADQIRQAPGPADGHVEPVAREEEFGTTGHVLGARGRHGEEDHLS